MQMTALPTPPSNVYIYIYIYTSRAQVLISEPTSPFIR